MVLSNPIRNAAFVYDENFLTQLREELLEATATGISALREVLPADQALSILADALALLKAEPTLLELRFHQPAMEGAAMHEVLVVGDTHGQFHDVCNLLDLMGMPSASRTYIFNGDFVDRGAWGMELLMLLVVLKLVCPTSVYLLRGNHESATCTRYYGFKGEVEAKYSPQPASQGSLSQMQLGDSAAMSTQALPPGVVPPMARPHANAKAVYKACKNLFAALPLAAVVQGNTLVLHGGLFRRPPIARKVGAKRQRRPVELPPPELGSLEELRVASKGGLDPDGLGASVVAADVLWSDPIAGQGLRDNVERGVGLIFGPDITQAFLERNNLSLIIRSHEGPDARDKRTDMGQVLRGYSVDHVTPAGNLVTVFSAPDYPQFLDAPVRYNNQGAVVALRAPQYCSPEFRSFDAVKPRPQALAFYDYSCYAETDEELGGGSEDGGSADMQGQDLSFLAPCSPDDALSYEAELGGSWEEANEASSGVKPSLGIAAAAPLWRPPLSDVDGEAGAAPAFEPSSPEPVAAAACESAAATAAPSAASLATPKPAAPEEPAAPLDPAAPDDPAAPAALIEWAAAVAEQPAASSAGEVNGAAEHVACSGPGSVMQQHGAVGQSRA